ncbi:hypothetical protein [Nitrosarchaeum sp. AC2]|uniref:hypothetical protein n=1 Tax=Nitrosarchaeum sp. AC2 TaxID=2259673 RepID=UPI0015C876F9|nr:hypothetical protein [Nitrosarchaeum sp. AC2]QLH11259.1 hypothetical protein DSQ20_07145 [Nitrosarchaeum sp. AC2]
MALTDALQIIFYGIIASHIIVSIIIIIIGYLKKNERIKHLPILFAINAFVFVLLVSIGTYFIDFKLIDFVAFIGYSIIISYVVTIEIPGYFLISKYDSNLTDVLQNLRQKSIQLNYNFDSVIDLRTYFNENKNTLSSITINELLDSFIKRCETIKNLDKSLYEITIKELGEHIQSTSSRSKHPFPKLIEIFSLAGISFLLGQLLNYVF